ncbi:MULTISPECIES: nitrate/nitrite two-component system sensor histidine kinase NarQ [Vibrio]|uniref:Sensor protein n=1 Tax=Vibrio mediterranei TaxID=689 RepID=A0A2S9ZRB3_9VIBR|nr:MULTISPECIES: nitrate/nitrite two-component system sensor histidine kinase NarQ [Vibrio]AYV23238.1 nitrate/nitrite two-component system sensor histidine kinase NarQ [Vibrio mediterranei]EDL55341.1 sensory histidine kinase in two-component regulatory system with NarP (NarL) [Vibrio mediterranei AK1]KFA98123.1 histidine kinase [Vibrio sp. ER1A]MCF4175000.1 nitrate/nitrite two-component system sensor histidine kinase NarQ [Vibrio sp. McD22-P3]MCG9627448.1 nitrate/nitrite two-component system s
MKKPNKSVTGTIAKAMILILLLSLATTNFAILTLASSLNDAEAVNVSGSMRMQSYRLAYDMQSDSPLYYLHVEQFERSLYSPSMKALQSWDVPEKITQDYYNLIIRWHELKSVLSSDDREQYLLLVADFVDRIDLFVLELQEHSENKLIRLAWAGGVGLGGILLVAVYVVLFVRKQIVRPLGQLISASEQIQNRSFDVEVDVRSDNELGILGNAFRNMAKDLGKLYRGLEQAVNEKTHKLQHAHQSLQVLYQSSQELTATRISHENFRAILTYIYSVEGISAVEIKVSEVEGNPWIATEGTFNGKAERVRPLHLDGEELGQLRYQVGLPCPDEKLIDNFVQILSRAIYYNKAQRQTEQIILMEERATIARELHDSLAQSLSYLKIQVTLLNRSISKELTDSSSSRSQLVLNDIREGLDNAYVQLRELLTTFRLSIKEGTFGEAITEMLHQLDEQTEAEIELDNQMSSLELGANEQVHILQLIREAVLNAMKHAQASFIKVTCFEDENALVTVKIKDDGVGFDQNIQKLDHYGMSIMKERAARLNAELAINSAENDGCEVVLTFQRSKEPLSERM